jgi:hypothetical protein
MSGIDHGDIPTKASRMITRREMIEQYPPPYHIEMRDKHGRRVSGTEHSTLSSLELEVQVALEKIKDAKDPSTDYVVTGIPKEIVLPKHQAREQP